jgi:hypothetical protein
MLQPGASRIGTLTGDPRLLEMPPSIAALASTGAAAA